MNDSDITLIMNSCCRVCTLVGRMALVLFSVLMGVALGCVSCAGGHRETAAERADSVAVVKKVRMATIFGVAIPDDELLAIKALAAKGILSCDTIMEKDGEFKAAVVEFAEVKFGLNKGFIFITSRMDDAAVDSVVGYIAQYYGDPEYEDTSEMHYQWNMYEGSPNIRIRPLHSEDGGLTMMWGFSPVLGAL